MAENIPFLSEETLAGLGITTGDVVESIETLIRGSAQDTVWSAPKAVILPADGRYMMAALAAMDGPSVLAVKTVVLNPRNSDKDGNWITAVRTAGLSAVAAKHMANEDATVCAFIGCGVQARSHLNAFAEMFPLEKIRVFGRGRTNIDRQCALAEELGLSPEICNSGKDTVAGADLVVTTVTYSADLEPFMDADWLAPGCFAAITDLGAPWHKDSFSAFDRIAIDDLEQEAALPNKLAAPEHVTGGDRTAFIFRGHALGDLALSALAFRKFSEA
jgi:ornithine cyclodeaminase/alanine dehydrogenase